MKRGCFLIGIAEGDIEFLSSNSTTLIEVGRICISLVPPPAEPPSDFILVLCYKTSGEHVVPYFLQLAVFVKG